MDDLIIIVNVFKRYYYYCYHCYTIRWPAGKFTVPSLDALCIFLTGLNDRVTIQ